MGKVSIGLRGWRFEEADVFTEDGAWRPLEEMPEDARKRVQRLTGLVNSPCDACWLVHGDESVRECNVVEVVYGEPTAEVTLCDDHEADFLYWFREEGGSDYRGSDELPDAFHEWFAGGGRAPDGYEGVEHVETDPESVPDPATASEAGVDTAGPGAACRSPTAGEGAGDAGPDGGPASENEDVESAENETAEANEGPVDAEDLDLSRDYPT